MKATKELARQLGLLRRHSTTPQQTRDVRRVKKTSQLFAYLIVIDFESTCWQDKRNANQEVIEFPAVLLNTSTGAIESEFRSYVLPEENPQLSAFCTEFTGITQDQVESGIPLRLCLSKFSRWLKKLEDEYQIAYNSEDDDDDDVKKLCTFVTWSDWDLSVCLHYECRRKQLLKPPVLNSWIDLRATYKSFYQRKPNGLHGALQDVGIKFHGRQHSGLDDARNTASLAWRMMCDGCVMKITRTMPGRQQMKRKLAHPPEQPDKPVPNGCMESDTSLVSYTQGICEDSMEKDISQPKTSLPSTTEDKITGNWHSKVPHKVEQVNKSGKRNNEGNTGRSNSNKPTSVLGSTSCTLQPNLSHKQVPIHPPSVTRTSCVPAPGNFRITSSRVASTNLLRSTAASPQSSGTFKTPLMNNTSEFKTPYLPGSYRTPGSTNFKTPSQTRSSLSVGKITPPMCQCGRRARRRLVQSPGPNMDRAFYSCSLGRKSSEVVLRDTTNTAKGCGYFKWESAILAEKQKLFASPVLQNHQRILQTTVKERKTSVNVQTSENKTPSVGFTGKRLGIAMRAVLQNQNQMRF